MSVETFFAVLILGMPQPQGAGIPGKGAFPSPPQTYADTVYMAESFEDEDFPPAAWYIDTLSAGATWSKVDSTLHPPGYAAYHGDSMARFNSYDDYGEARLVTDTLSLENASSPRLVFAMFHDNGYATGRDSLIVEIKAKSGSASWPSTWTRLAKYERYNPDSDYWSLDTLDLLTYVGDSVLIGFRAISDFGNDIYIDNIWVGELPYTDVGVAGLDTIDAEPLVTGDTDTWKVWVENPGVYDQSNFPVYMWVQGEGVVDSSVVAALSAGDSTLVAFTWTPAGCGPKSVKFYTKLTGDESARNDTLKLEYPVFCSQSAPLTETFEGSFPPSGWIVWDKNGDDYAWHRSSLYAYQGTYSARTPDDGTGWYPNSSEDWLYSPLIDLGTSSGNGLASYAGVLSYHHLDSLESNYDYVRVRIRSYSSYDDPTPTETAVANHTGLASSWTQTRYLLQTADRYNVILWRFVSDDALQKRGFFLDSVRFSTQFHNVAVDSILAPSDTVQKNTSRQPQIRVRNNGSFNETFHAYFYIYRGSNVIYGDTVANISLASGTSQTVTFDSWTVSGENATTYTAKALVSLSGDEWPRDDTLEQDVTVYAHEGSDTYGWTWKDALASGGPTYSWIELYNNTAGADSVDTLTLGDDGEDTVRILPSRSPLRLYGRDFQAFVIGCNGGMDFTNAQIRALNTALPATNQGLFFAVFWEDLYCASGQTANGDSLVYVGYFGDTLIVLEWYSVPIYNSTNHLTFEALIRFTSSGPRFIYQYKNLSSYPTGANATIGLQDTAATTSNGRYILYTYNETPYTPSWAEPNGFAIEFVPPQATEKKEERLQVVLKPEFRLLPTITTGPLRLYFALPQTAHVQASLYNASGRRVRRLIQKVYPRGVHTVAVDLKDLASGVYFLVVKSPVLKARRTLVLVR